MYKKATPYIISALLVGGALTAFAQTDTATDTTVSSPVITNPIIIKTDEAPKTNMPTINKPVMPQIQKEMILQVGPKGEVLLRGVLVSATAGVITVKSWGGVWTVNIPTTAEVLPVAVNNDVTKFVVGDYIGVQGYMSTSESWTINAKVVRNREPASEKPGRGEEHAFVESGATGGQTQYVQQGKPVQNYQNGETKPQPKPLTQGQASTQVKPSEGDQNKQQGIQSQIQLILQQISELRSRLDKNIAPKPTATSASQTSATTQTTATAPIQ